MAASRGHGTNIKLKTKTPKGTTAENTAKGETMEILNGTTQVSVMVKPGATNAEIASALRWRANLIDGMDPKTACSVEAIATPAVSGKKSAAKTAPAAEPEVDADEDFGGEAQAAPAKKFTKKSAPAKQAASFDDEDEAPEVEETASDDDGDFMEAAPAKETKKKKLTVNDVNDACKAKAQATDRKTVLGILKKQFGVTSVTELDSKQYADVIKAMA